MNTLISQSTSFLYTFLLKPIFFQFDPEFVHNHLVWSGQQLGKVPLLRNAVTDIWSYQEKTLSKTLNGITFANPVGLSAGFDYNGELSHIIPSVGFGWHTIGTVTLGAYEGNTPPRLGRLPRSKALIVNKGLKNNGAAEIINRLQKVKFTIPTGISIASTNRTYHSDQQQLQDIVECFKIFEKSKLKHAYYELNISCPNTFGGEPFTTPTRLKELLAALDKIQLQKPLYIKLPIDLGDKKTLQLLKVIDEHRTQGVIIGNLTKDHTNPAVHPEDKKIWQRRPGNLSGKPTWERSNHLIALTKKKYGTRFTIIGTGGIFSGEDAATKLKLGADLVQLITGMIYQGPQLIGQINHHLANQVFNQRTK